MDGERDLEENLEGKGERNETEIIFGDRCVS